MNKIARSKNVLSAQLAHERTWHSNQRLLERLEAENAQLRDSLVNLMLQIQALRERTRPSAV
jgi:hypothetical protein